MIDPAHRKVFTGCFLSFITSRTHIPLLLTSHTTRPGYKNVSVCQHRTKIEQRNAHPVFMSTSCVHIYVCTTLSPIIIPSRREHFCVYAHCTQLERFQPHIRVHYQGTCTHVYGGAFMHSLITGNATSFSFKLSSTKKPPSLAASPSVNQLPYRYLTRHGYTC